VPPGAVLPRAVLLRMAVLAGIWAGLTGLLIAAGELVVHSAAITHFDDHVTRVVVSARTAPLNSAMKAVTWLGSWVALLVTALIIAGLVISRRLQVLALIVAVFAWAGGSGGVTLAKHVVGRERPPRAIWLVQAHGWSFPSGHTATASLVFPVLALTVATLTRHRAVAILGWVVAGLAIAAVAFSRVELGVHWTTDVVASIVLVAVWLTAIAISLGGRLRPPEPAGEVSLRPRRWPRRAARAGSSFEGRCPAAQTIRPDGQAS